MSEIDLEKLGKKIRVRRLRKSDYPAVKRLQLKCFPGMGPWTPEQFESQLKHFADGQICVEYQRKVVASSSSLIVDFKRYTDWHNWREIADSGYIRNHDPEGDTLYGIEIMVDPDMRGTKLARRLYEARKQIARDHNLLRIMIGGRIPGYGKVAEEMSAREYVERVMEKSMVDQVLTPQLANGFVLKRLIPNYLPADSESRGYATFLEWTNLDYVPEKEATAIAPVRLCVVQYQMRTVRNFDEFAAQCRFFVDCASDYKGDFVVFPELHTTQLLSCIKAHRPGLAARKLAEFTPQYLELFRDMAIKFNINIVGGSQFTVEDDKLYNVAYLFRRDGTLDKQYKIHATPSERHWWGVASGDEVRVFDTDRGKVAILICYDVQFPELVRIAVGKGAQILFVPYNTDERSGYLRVRYCAQARAVENHLYVAIAGCTGNLPFVENADIHYAESAIFSPSDVCFNRDGVAAECTPNIETVIVHDVDLGLLRRHRAMGTVLNWSDRRTDLYSVRYRDGEGEEEQEI